MTDPFSIEDLVKGARTIGANVLYLPCATYPIHIRGLGGRSVDDACKLRDELTRVIEVAIADNLEERTP